MDGSSTASAASAASASAAGKPALTVSLDIPERDTEGYDEVEHMKTKKREKVANPFYDYKVGGKINSTGARTKWQSKFEKPLEYFLFPSLQLLPPEIQDKEIVVSPVKITGKGKGRVGLGNGGNNSPKSMANHRGSPTHRGSPKGGNRSPSPGRRKRKGKISSPADDHSHIDPYGSEDEMEEEEEERPINYSRPDIYWDLAVATADPAKPEDAAEIRQRQFRERLEVGEKYQRGRFSQMYEDGIREVERQKEEDKRIKKGLQTSLKAVLFEKERLAAHDKARAGAGRRRGRGLSIADTGREDENSPNGEQSAGGRGRRESSVGGKFPGNSVLENMNTPQYIYKALRNAGKKKQGAGEVLGGFLESIKNQMSKEDDGGGHVDDAGTYARQNQKLKEIFGEKGYEENAFDVEGLLFYRFQYDAQQEAEKKEEQDELDARLAMIQPGKGSYVSGGSSLSTSLKSGVLKDEDEEDSQFAPLMAEFNKSLLKTHKGAAVMKSDASTVNLSRLRRAVQHSLNGMSDISMNDTDAILDAAQETVDNAKSAALLKATSPNKSKKLEKPLQEIRDREEKSFMAGMGLAVSKGKSSPSPHSPVRPSTAPGKGSNGSPNGASVDPYGFDVGSVNGAGGIATFSPEIHRGSKLNQQGVTGTTRTAQDALVMAQLQKGILPTAFISRSDNLEFIDIDISSYSIGDEQGLCLATAIRGLSTLRKLFAEDNRLTSRSLPAIIGNIYPNRLITLNLSSNMLHNEGVVAVGQLLSNTDCVLNEVILAKCGVTCADVPLLVKGLRASNVKYVNLSNNGIAVTGSLNLASLMEYDGCTIKNLDLSWNKVGTDGSIAIANALSKNTSLTCLSLSANGISDKGGQKLASALYGNKHIEELLLNQNNLAGGCCFVFSKAIMTHPKIQKLDLSFNPVGEAGARSIYRQIMRGLRCFVVMRSCSYFIQDGMFDYATPSLKSPYEIDLAEPYQESIMKELMYMVKESPASNRFGPVKFTSAGSAASAGNNTEEINLIEKNGEIYSRGKIWKMPKTGKLLVPFYSAITLPKLSDKVADKSLEVMKLIITHAREQDRLDYLKLITADLYMTCEQAQSVIQTFIQHQIIGSGGLRKIDILACTWTRLLDTENMYDFMCANVIPSERRLLINEVSIDEYKFNWTNPTGHWRLNLEQNKQLHVLMKIISINQTESEFSRTKSGRDDTSQEGNWFNFRNAKMINRKGAVSINIDQDFCDNIPRTGIIDFDFVSTTRPLQRLRDAAEGTTEVAATTLVDEATDNVDADDDDVDGDEGGGAGPDGSRPGTTDAGASRPSTSNGNPPKKSNNPHDQIVTITDETFYGLMSKLGLSNRKRVSAENSLFPLIELQLAVTKYWFTVQQVVAVMDMFDIGNFHTQSNVAVAMFSRIKDLHNSDQLMRSVEVKTQRAILNRLGPLNVLNPLKLALHYFIPMTHLDYRVLLTTLLEISPQEGTEQIREDAKTDVSVLTFYGALHRICAVSRPEVLKFMYLDFGVQSHVVAWGMRRDALKKFLVGTQPMDKSLFRIVGMYREMEKHGTLSRGPVELQYANHFKIMKNARKQAANDRTASQTVTALRTKVTEAKATASASAATTATTATTASNPETEEDATEGGDDDFPTIGAS